MNSSPIGIFDSGAGGLCVLSACRRNLPREDFIYLADILNSPYGNKSDAQIAGCAAACTQRLLSLGCKAVVVACNTATNAAIKVLRESFCCPLVGVEPALKPAALADGLKNAVLLCTPATASSEKFHHLYQKFGSGKITVAPQKDLAALIENNLTGLEKIRPRVHKILNPFINADGVILGCTHYIFIESMICDFYRGLGKNIRIFDGSLGAAARLKVLLKEKDLLSAKKSAGSVKVIY